MGGMAWASADSRIGFCLVFADRMAPCGFGEKTGEIGVARCCGRLDGKRDIAHLIYGVVKSGKPFDANFAMNGVAIQDGI